MLLGQTASIPDTVVFVDGNVSIPIIITDVVELEGLEFMVQYDETVLMAMSTSFENTELDGMNFNSSIGLDNSGEIMVVAWAGGSLYSGSGALIFINFDVIGELLESTNLTFISLEINNISILESAQNGSVTIDNNGCTDMLACNYNDLAEIDDGSCIYVVDCGGECGGTSLLDECGACDALPSNDCVQDCNEEWGGSAEYDDCGICSGDNSTCIDCAGTLNGNAIKDCNGDCNGMAVYDMCGTCDTDSENDCTIDCTGVWGGILVNDECGWCGGDGCHEGDCETYPADQFDCDGTSLANSFVSPFEFKLLPNYPNPFNPSTTINYSVVTFSVVNISIYSMNGELIHILVNSLQQPGQYAVQWNALNFPSGLYLVKLNSENKIAEQKVLLIK